MAVLFAQLALAHYATGGHVLKLMEISGARPRLFPQARNKTS